MVLVILFVVLVVLVVVLVALGVVLVVLHGAQTQCSEQVFGTDSVRNNVPSQLRDRYGPYKDIISTLQGPSKDLKMILQGPQKDLVRTF